jgi:hypothetical protein
MDRAFNDGVSTIPDPNKPNTFWLSNEYVANGWWQTAVAQVEIKSADTSIPTVASITTSGAGITSGNGDLNAGKTSRFRSISAKR